MTRTVLLLVLACLVLCQAPVAAGGPTVNDAVVLWAVDTGDRIDSVLGSYYSTFDGDLVVFLDVDGDYLQVAWYKEWVSIHAEGIVK